MILRSKTLWKSNWIHSNAIHIGWTTSIHFDSSDLQREISSYTLKKHLSFSFKAQNVLGISTCSIRSSYFAYTLLKLDVIS